MDFELPPLPYEKDALEPHIGRETLTVHHEKHHAGYLEKLEQLLSGEPLAEKSLEEIVLIADGDVLSNAAQAWNHEFYWHSMRPGGGGKPSEELTAAIERDLGGLDHFRANFLEQGKSHFGSGWVWLCLEGERLRVCTTHDADLPLRHGRTPLLCADLWEHAYYLDYRNDRERYLEAFVDHLLDWEFAAANWKRAMQRMREAAC